MKKNKWLQETVFVDEFGRPYNLSDVPMTYMTRNESFKKRGLSEKEIDALYHKEQNTIIIEGC